MKKILSVLCVLLFTNMSIAQAANHRITNHYINCYRPSGQRHLYIHEEDTGKHKLFLKKIRTIKDRDKTSIYFNDWNILVFEDEQSKQDTIDCWNQCYKNHVRRRKKTDLSSLEQIFKEIFWGKVENGWR